MNKQLEHSEVKRTNSLFDIVVVCDYIIDPVNIGGLFRLSDALGVKELIFLDTDESVLSKKAISVSRSTVKTIPYKFLTKAQFLEMPVEGNAFCLELTSLSKPITDCKLQAGNINYVILGNERNGVSKELLNRFAAFHIPILGTNSSMNVVNALGVALGKLIF